MECLPGWRYSRRRTFLASIWNVPHENLFRPDLRPFRRQSTSSIRWGAAEKPWRGVALAVRLTAGSGDKVAGVGAEPVCGHAAAAGRRRQGAAVSFVGHASWLIQTAGSTSCSIPCGRACIAVHVSPGRSVTTIPASRSTSCRKIDIVLVSHGHYDHLDLRDAVEACGKILATRDHAARQRSYDAQRRRAYQGRGVRLGGSRRDSATVMAVTLVPTRHWSARGVFDRNKTLWASFVLETPAGKLYIVCDSGYGDGRQALSAGSPKRTVRSGLRSSPSAPMSRAGSCKRPAHESVRCREGARRLRRAAGAGASSRDVSS